MKEQKKTPQKELNKMEITNLPDAEFKTLVVKLLSGITVDELSENFTKEMGTVKYRYKT